MSKSKRIDLICGIGAVLMVLVTLLVMCGGGTFITAAAIETPYVSKLFSTDRVHEIDIVASGSDWQNMLDNATSEEYISCTVVIDGEKFSNVAIRPKGNSSLSTVASSDSDRYSFKIEFDHYESGKSYHGLDKLCLNNAIQDNTYMKDYICYQMMNFLGADAPESSFAWITVNGSDWGLYTAVEGIEDSFARRKYGTNHGQIYKPDSMDMGGGGRGAEKGDRENNGGFNFDFDIETVKDFLVKQGVDEQAIENFLAENETFSMDSVAGFLTENGIDMSDLKDIFFQTGEMPDNQNPFENAFDRDSEKRNDKNFELKGGFSAMSSDDVLLCYSDDNPDSYPNIFDNAVFNNVSNEDKARLIASIKAMNEGNIETSVNIDEVIRYFAVHNFVLNEDSYTGSITHNYYLYEDDGLLSMIAWDYNLAFGGMGMGGQNSATDYVNSPIDSPVTSGDIADRPMVSWIFSSEEYTTLYHAAMNELITDLFESGAFETMIDNAVALISPYVEKDPTAFCTYEEFEKGVQTLKKFCMLRAESIRGQLDGTIPSTSESQAVDSTALVDASHLTVSDMGSQNNGIGGAMKSFDRTVDTRHQAGFSEEKSLTSTENDKSVKDDTPPDGFGGMEIPEGFEGGTPPEKPNEDRGGMPSENAPPNMPNDANPEQATIPEDKSDSADETSALGNDDSVSDTADLETQPENKGDNGGEIQTFGKGDFRGEMGERSPSADSSVSVQTWLMLGGSLFLLLAGLLFAKFYK